MTRVIVIEHPGGSVLAIRPGVLQRFRAEHPLEVELLSMSAYLVDYPFVGRLFPSALKVLRRGLGSTVTLSDGDVVFQPRKVERAGLSNAVGGRVVVYIHKEEALDDIERRFPVGHYVPLDDKPRILAAVERFWADRITTLFARQGNYAHDPQTIGAIPQADIAIEHIGDLPSFDLPRLQPKPPMPASKLESPR